MGLRDECWDWTSTKGFASALVQEAQEKMQRVIAKYEILAKRKCVNIYRV
jgi:hypothetical protein